MNTAHRALHDAIKDEIADMENLSRHAEFVQISAVKRNLEALLNLCREANAEAYSAQRPHQVVA